MKLQIIKTEKQYDEALNWVDQMFDKKVKPNSREGEILQVALLLIKDYEDKYYPVPVPNCKK